MTESESLVEQLKETTQEYIDEINKLKDIITNRSNILNKCDIQILNKQIKMLENHRKLFKVSLMKMRQEINYEQKKEEFYKQDVIKEYNQYLKMTAKQIKEGILWNIVMLR